MIKDCQRCHGQAFQIQLLPLSQSVVKAEFGGSTSSMQGQTSSLQELTTIHRGDVPRLGDCEHNHTLAGTPELKHDLLVPRGSTQTACKNAIRLTLRMALWAGSTMMTSKYLKVESCVLTVSDGQCECMRMNCFVGDG